jgi:hypothetical protein
VKPIKITEVAFVYYGLGPKDKNLTCDLSLFSFAVVEDDENPSDDLYEVKVRSGLRDFMGELATPDQYLSVELLTENSVYVTLSDKKLSDPGT